MNTNYILIDRDNMVFGPASRDVNMCSMISWLEYSNVATVMLALENRRGFSTFSRLELMLLYKNMSGETGNFWDMADLIVKCHEMASQVPLDQRSVFELEAATKKLPHVPAGPLPKKPVIQKYVEGQPKGSPNPQNGAVTDFSGGSPAPISHPSPKGSTGKVWEIADQIKEEVGGVIDKAMRTKIIDKCVAEGIHPATAATQYSKWKATK